MTQLMSRIACCLDNNPTEGLCGIIKTKMYEIQNNEDLIEAIHKYIKFCNYQCYQSRFGSRTLIKVRERSYQ